MAIIKSFLDIPTKFAHKDIFEQYNNEIENINASEYAEIVGSTKQNISVKFKNNSKLLEKERISLVKHLKSIKATKTLLYEYLYKPNTDDKEILDNVKIPVKAEVLASCGNGRDVYDEDTKDELSLPIKLLDYFGATKNMTEIIYAEGDSMSPEIKAQDMLLVDKSKTTIFDGLIYVFSYNGQPMCKQLKVSGESIIAISKNSNYAPFVIDKSLNFKVIGRVVGSFHPITK